MKFKPTRLLSLNVATALAAVLAFAIVGEICHAQTKTENIIIVTLDGFRWQEVFGGMDSAVANRSQFHKGDSAGIFQRYWSADPGARREKLLPFVWTTMAHQGQLYGNRRLGSKVDVANRYWFSYPGYNEIFTGYPDTAVNSNSYPNNPHTNVLEFLNGQPGFQGKVAAFGSWDAFTRILNASRCGFPVVAAFDSTSCGTPTDLETFVRTIKMDSFKPWGLDECFDVFTYYAALEHLKAHRPRVLYIGLGETDEFAHGGYYGAYLEAAHQADQWLQELWKFVQNDPQYRDRTALFVAVDHGRGDMQKKQWTGHGQSVPDAHEIWFGVLGPDIAAKGESTTASQSYASQYAQTIASLLGFKFVAEHPTGERLRQLFPD